MFLRNVRSTDHSRAWPFRISIVGTFAAMYALGYSLDNLSLMGLTIAVASLIDDAIVEVETSRGTSEGEMMPLAGAPKGYGRNPVSPFFPSACR